MTRRKLIAGNWKMNTSLAEAHTLARSIVHGTEHLNHVETVLCPPFPWIVSLAEHDIPKEAMDHLSLGAQDIHHEEAGAFTGEVSAAMLKDFVQYCIVGHSERVRDNHETPEETSHKVRALLDNGITPIICVGEQEPSDHSVADIVHTLNAVTHGLTLPELEKIVVAYEPVWAIGTGRAATPEYAQPVLHALRSVTTPKTRILYGGSANETNFGGFLDLHDCDGALVGGASLKAQSFLALISMTEQSIIKRHTS